MQIDEILWAIFVFTGKLCAATELSERGRFPLTTLPTLNRSPETTRIPLRRPRWLMARRLRPLGRYQRPASVDPASGNDEIEVG